MGEDPDVIRAEIEQTRAEMGDTVDALGYKADVKSRAKEKVTDKVSDTKDKITGTVTSAKEKVTGTASSATSSVTDRASGAGSAITDRASGAGHAITDRASGAGHAISDRTPSAGEVKARGKQVVGLAQENPLGLAIGSIAVGFLAGLLVPSSRIEDEKLGPVADQVKEQVSSTAHEALERGKEVATQAAGAAKDTVQEQGKEQAEGLRSSAQERASNVSPT